MRKILKNTILTTLILTLTVSTALLVYLHFFAPDDNDLSGEWVTELDITEQAVVTAYAWLQDIEAVTVSLEDVGAHMPELTVQVNLVMEQSSQSEGAFSSNVLPESYAVCEHAAYEAFAGAFRELLTERLRMAGYTGGTDEETVERLVIETFGMPTVSYLMSYGPDLLPALEELQAEYDGSGVYAVTDDILTRQYESGRPGIIREERFVRKDSGLILSEDTGAAIPGLFSDHYPILYTLKRTQVN